MNTRVIKCDITQEDEDNQKGDILVGPAPFETYPIEPELMSGVYRRKDEDNAISLIIGNPANTPRFVKKGQVITVFKPIEQEELEDFLPPDKKTDIKLDTVTKKQPLIREAPLTPEEIFNQIKIPTDLDLSSINRLTEMIKKNVNAFTRFESDVGNFIAFDYVLRLLQGFTGCVFRRQFPISDEKKVYLARWIAKMKRAQVIERATESRWNSPIFVVPKSNPGEFRLVSDLREVNKVLKKDFVQARSLNQIFAEIQATNPNYFSALDVKSAFFGINYKEGTNDPTSFYADCGTNLNPFTGECDTGKYRYKILVLGSQASSAALEREMKMTLQGIPGVNVLRRRRNHILIYEGGAPQQTKESIRGRSKIRYKICPRKNQVMLNQAKLVRI